MSYSSRTKPVLSSGSTPMSKIDDINEFWSSTLNIQDMQQVSSLDLILMKLPKCKSEEFYSHCSSLRDPNVQVGKFLKPVIIPETIVKNRNQSGQQRKASSSIRTTSEISILLGKDVLIGDYVPSTSCQYLPYLTNTSVVSFGPTIMNELVCMTDPVYASNLETTEVNIGEDQNHKPGYFFLPHDAAKRLAQNTETGIRSTELVIAGSLNLSEKLQKETHEKEREEEIAQEMEELQKIIQKKRREATKSSALENSDDEQVWHQEILRCFNAYGTTEPLTPRQISDFLGVTLRRLEPMLRIMCEIAAPRKNFNVRSGGEYNGKTFYVLRPEYSS